MLKDFYEDYKEFKEKKDNYCFECDKKNLENGCLKNSAYKDGDKRKTAIHFELLPQPFIGDVENAKIIICSLNPGFSTGDYKVDESHRDDILEQLNPDNHNKTLFWLTEKPDNEGNLSGGAKWWQGKLDQKDKNKSLVYNIIKKYKSDVASLSDEQLKKEKEKVFKVLSENMAAIELFPYHSEKFNRKYVECCSTQKIKDYVWNTLVKNAKKNQLICFTRSFALWEKKEVPNVIYNPSVQNITFNITKDFGGAIFEHIKKHLIEDLLK